MWQIHEISASYSCFALLSPKFAQILKYFAQSCDCMIAAFRNSAFPYSPLRRSGLYIYIGQKWHRTSFTYCLIKHLIIFSYCSYILNCSCCSVSERKERSSAKSKSSICSSSQVRPSLQCFRMLSMANLNYFFITF